MADAPLCLLLLTRPLESFILHDQAVDLLRAPGVVAIEPPRVPYGALLRLPEPLADRVAAAQARRLTRGLAAHGRPKVVVMFHAVQYRLARALLAGQPDGELWYSRWDRYEEAYDASPKQRAQLAELHVRAAERSAYTFAVSTELVRLEEEAGRTAHLVPSAADAFPALDLGPAADHARDPNLVPSRTSRPPSGRDVRLGDEEGDGAAPVAISLGHLGWRTDWALLRGTVDALPALTLHLVGEWHEDESGDDPDFVALRTSPRVVWHGRLADPEAAALILDADVGLVPFTRTPFNDAGLPNRILKYARQGRRTVSPSLAGARTWERAVTFADGPAAFAEAIAAHAGARHAPDRELRDWALTQNARAQNAPLWERLETLEVDVRA